MNYNDAKELKLCSFVTTPAGLRVSVREVRTDMTTGDITVVCWDPDLGYLFFKHFEIEGDK